MATPMFRVERLLVVASLVHLGACGGAQEAPPASVSQREVAAEKQVDPGSLTSCPPDPPAQPSAAASPNAVQASDATSAPTEAPGEESPGETVIPFGAGMERPRMICGPDPLYTKEAIEAHVEGRAIIKCRITKEGRLVNCRVIKSLHLMDAAIVKALEARRYTPVLFQGKPIAVDYVFNLTFILPAMPAPPPP